MPSQESTQRWSVIIFIEKMPFHYPFTCEKAAQGFAEAMKHFGYETAVGASCAQTS